MTISKKNLAIEEKLKKVAAGKEVTPGQLAIAWILAQPGITSALVASKYSSQVEENATAVNCKFTEDDLEQISKILSGKN